MRAESVDTALLRVMRTRGHTPGAERAAAAFSRLGEHAALWLAIGAAGLTLDARRRADWRDALAAVGLTYVLNTTIKLAVRRKRPELPGLAPLTGTPTKLSFPSAHAASSFAGARAYARLGLPCGPLYALAGGLCASRLYLCVHYPSDVLAGALLGDRVSAAWLGARSAGGTAA